MPAIPNPRKLIMAAWPAFFAAYGATSSYTFSRLTDVSKSATFPYVAMLISRGNAQRTNNTWWFQHRVSFVYWTRYAQGEGDEGDAETGASNIAKALTNSTLTGLTDFSVIIQEPEQDEELYYEDDAFDYYGVRIETLVETQYTGA